MVCSPFGAVVDCQVELATPPAAATAGPSHAPSSEKRTAGSGVDAVSATAALADAPFVGAMIVGRSVGGASGVTAFETTDAALGPAAFVAVTLNVYDTPL